MGPSHHPLVYSSQEPTLKIHVFALYVAFCHITQSLLAHEMHLFDMEIDLL